MSAIAQIMRHWFGPAVPGWPAPLWSGYPDDYIYFDTETSGKEFGLDLILEVGWAVVRGRRIVDNGSVLLDWRHVLAPTEMWWLNDRIVTLRQTMIEKGRNYKITPELLAAQGEYPRDVLAKFGNLLAGAISDGELLVSHNGWFFDRHMLDANLQRFIGRKLPWHADALWDTGLAEKAAQYNRLPWLGDTLDKWFARVNCPPHVVKWSLEPHCLEKYQLTQRFGLDPNDSHRADFDCRAGVCLFETFRDIGEGRFLDPVLGRI